MPEFHSFFEKQGRFTSRRVLSWLEQRAGITVSQIEVSSSSLKAMAPSGSAKHKRGTTTGAAVAAAGKGNANTADVSTSTSTSTAASDFAGLVPSSADEFRSLEFWDGFFRARGDVAFEWYGDWRTLKPILLPLCLERNGDGGGGRKPTPTSAPTPPPAEKKILMLGCGNSELSAQMYDAGCQRITNVDFCPSVIREMMLKNLRRRPRMQWLVADVTALPRGSRHFPASGFGVVVDKGALDALHSEEEDGGGGGGGGEESVDFSRGGAAAAAGLAASVRGALAPGGRYACVTLCQRAVLAGLLASYRLEGGWEVSIEAPPPPPDMASSPLQPLCVVVRRPTREEEEEKHGEREEEGGGDAGGGDGGGRGKTRSLSFSPVVCRVLRPRIDAPNAEQLADVFSVVAAENAARRSGEPSAWVRAADALSSAAAESPATPARPSAASSRPSSAAPAAPPAPPAPPAVSFDELCPGREVQVPLPQEHQSSGREKEGGKPRYVATVVDCDPPPRISNRAPSRVLPPPPPTCSVFIVPQGREHEWLFSTREGRATVAAQVGASRCVFVAAAAGAPFPRSWDAAALQRDLDPLVLPLTLAALRGVPRAVPFVTLGEGLGRAPTLVCEVASEVSGTALLVEDVATPPGDGDGGEEEEGSEGERDGVAVVVGARRLVFGGARSLIQSEVPLVVARRRRGGGGGGEGAAAREAEPLPALSTHLPSAYHCAILAGLAALGGGASDGTSERGEEEGGSGRRSVLLVGLGAGGLAAHLAAERRCSVTAVELDPCVVELARDHFGLRAVEEELLLRLSSKKEEAGEGEGKEERKGWLAVVVGDGVVEVAKAAAAAAASKDSPSASSSSFSAIIVDAGGGDASLAMSCPPPPFAAESFAASAAAALLRRSKKNEGEGGAGSILAINCVSRDQRPVSDLVSTLKGHFSRVFEIDVPEDVNRVLFATGPKGGRGGGEGAPKGPKEPPLPRGEEAVSKALDVYFGGASSGSVSAPVNDPGAAAGGSSVAEMANLLVER